MGVLYVVSSIGKKVGPEPIRDLLLGINKVAHLAAQPNDESQYFWALGSTNFTPSRLTEPAPIHNDRPYASLLYLGAGYQASAFGDVLAESEFRFGVLGTNIGHYVQTRIHRVCCPEKIPQGWDNQIGDGGSPTFLYHLRYLFPVETPRPEYSRLYFTLGGEVGWYVRGLAGVALAIGGSPRDLEAIRLGGSASGATPFIVRPGLEKLDSQEASPQRQSRPKPASSRSRGLGFWFEYEASLMGYNQLLQGAWSGTNRVTFSSSDMTRVVHRASAGVDLAFIPKLLPWLHDKEFHVYYTQGFRSRDLKVAPYGNHAWGGITFSVDL
jgi:hypothetical protein